MILYHKQLWTDLQRIMHSACLLDELLLLQLHESVGQGYDTFGL